MAGLATTLVALLHVAIVVIGAPGYRYFGAGEEMARQAEAGSWRPALVTLALTLVFAAWAAYAFAGAGLIGPLPFLLPALRTIGAISTLRGLVLLPQLILRLTGRGAVPVRHLAFSAVALLIGLAYLAGDLAARGRPAALKLGVAP